MTPETLVPTLAAAKRIAELAAVDLYSLAKGAVADARAAAKIKSATARVAKHIHEYRLVKTLLHPEKPVDLYSFYLPPAVGHAGGGASNLRPKSSDDLFRSQRTRAVAVIGTVGQGKSMFLRYLATQEIVSERVPLLIELRNAAPCTILDAIGEELEQMGFGSLSKPAIKKFLLSGHATVLLDGLDEVAPAKVRSETLLEIERFARKYPEVRLVVSSRPGTSLESSRCFEVVRLQPVSFDDVPKLIAKYSNDHASAERLVRTLNGGQYGEMVKLLTTPLLVSLLVLRYRIEQTIPTTYSEFYRDLFDLLFTRHDRLKPAFRRRRASALTDGELRELFEAICFVTRRRGPTPSGELDSGSHRRPDFMRATREAGAAVGVVSADAEKGLDDIAAITCLILEEGGIYRFIHRSVQEYHAAAFIMNYPDADAAVAYAHMLSGGWEDWPQELAFLMQIDSVRFWRHFGCPSLESDLRWDERLGAGPRLEEWIERHFGDDVLSVHRYHKNGGLMHMTLKGGKGYWLSGGDVPSREPRGIIAALGGPDGAAGAVAWCHDLGSQYGRLVVVPEFSADAYEFTLREVIPKLRKDDRARLHAGFSRVRAALEGLRDDGRSLLAIADRRSSLLPWPTGRVTGR